MGAGAGLVFVAAGAVLRFAVDDRVNGVNLHAIGVILMIVGVVAVLIDLLLFMPRRRRVVTRSTSPYAASAVTRVEDERY
jgi:hypothetical protein